MAARLRSPVRRWPGVLGLSLALLGAPALAQTPPPMTMPHLPTSHGAGEGGCRDPALACASTVTPTFAPDGTLWLAFDTSAAVFVVHSDDLGRNFTKPVAITSGPVRLDAGPDARPSIAVDRQGRVYVAYAVFKDDHFNGEVFLSRSLDGGQSFSPPRPLVDNTASQRFQTLTIDPQGGLFAAWLDKRGVAAAAQQGQKYAGAALAYSWSTDGGATFSPSRVAHDNTCECCRMGVAFPKPGQPAILFRNIFDGTVRDHAVITFAESGLPGPLERVSDDEQTANACPHHGPSLAVSPSGAYHAVWFTKGEVRSGLFYARSADGGRSFSTPLALGNPDHNLSRPSVMALAGAVWVAWKDFDGNTATVDVIVSRDDGMTWSAPRMVAKTTDASDHPLLVTDGRRGYLSWMTKADGYRWIPLGTGS